MAINNVSDVVDIIENFADKTAVKRKISRELSRSSVIVDEIHRVFFVYFFYYSLFHTYILFLWINKDDLSMKNKLFGGNDNES